VSRNSARATVSGTVVVQEVCKTRQEVHGATACSEPEGACRGPIRYEYCGVRMPRPSVAAPPGCSYYYLRFRLYPVHSVANAT